MVITGSLRLKYLLISGLFAINQTKSTQLASYYINNPDMLKQLVKKIQLRLFW